MTNFPAMFRRSVESLYAMGNLSRPFMEAAMKAFDAIFEGDTADGNTSCADIARQRQGLLKDMQNYPADAARLKSASGKPILPVLTMLRQAVLVPNKGNQALPPKGIAHLA